MNTRARMAMVVLAAVPLGIGALARAEPTLRYNYDYVCSRGLRIVVGHCRHDSDMPGVAPTRPEDDYCQVYYPDRPKTGGIEAMEVVLRADLIQSLQACGAIEAATSGTSAIQGTAAGQPRAAPAQASSKPPPAAAAPSSPTPAKSVAPTLSGPAFCDAIRHAGSLAVDGFRSIDLGPGQELSETINVHKTSLRLPGASGCGVDHERGKPNEYACTWPQDDAALQQFSELARTLKSCIGGQYEFHEATADVDYYAIARKAGVEYEAMDNHDFVSLAIRPITAAPAQVAAGSPASAPAAPAQGSRPSVKPMPIGPEMCPLLRRLEGLAREDFRSIDRGPDRAAGKDAEKFHRTSMPIPGADCSIVHSPGEPVAYMCNWPPATEKEVDQQFVNLGKALETCSAQKLDLSQLEFGDVTVKLHGIKYTASVISTRQHGDFLALDVHMAEPGGPSAPSSNSAAAPAPSHPGNGATQGDTRVEMPQQFCKDIVQLRSLAPQGFKSIDLGQIKGEAAGVHESSIRLLNNPKCFITRKPGETPNYRCGWGINEKSGVDVVGNWLASCFNARADWVDRNGTRFIKIESASVQYTLSVNAGSDLLILNVKPTVPMTGTAR